MGLLRFRTQDGGKGGGRGPDQEGEGKRKRPTPSTEKRRKRASNMETISWGDLYKGAGKKKQKLGEKRGLSRER